MNKSRKILTAGFLAAVTGLSISLGAAAAESKTYGDEIDSYPVTGADNLPGEEDIGKKEYIGDFITQDTSGGTAGYVPIRCGAYKRNDSDGSEYYGISAEVYFKTISDHSGEVIGNNHNVNSRDITIEATLYKESGETTILKDSVFFRRLDVEALNSPSDKYTHCVAVITTHSDAFGESSQRLIVSLGAAAAESKTYGDEIDSYPVTGADNLPGEEDSGKKEYIGDFITQDTSGGTAGYVPIRCGAYKRNDSDGSEYYGISAEVYFKTISDFTGEVIGNDHNVNSRDITIEATLYKESGETTILKDSVFFRRLDVEALNSPSDKYTHCVAVITTHSDAFGESSQRLIVSFE